MTLAGFPGAPEDVAPRETQQPAQPSKCPAKGLVVMVVREVCVFASPITNITAPNRKNRKSKTEKSFLMKSECNLNKKYVLEPDEY
jgi:hypothetical protein